MLDRETGMRVFARVATPLFGRRADVVAIDAPSRARESSALPGGSRLSHPGIGDYLTTCGLELALAHAGATSTTATITRSRRKNSTR